MCWLNCGARRDRLWWWAVSGRNGRLPGHCFGRCSFVGHNGGMNRILLFLMALVSFSMLACGGGGDSSEPSDGEKTAAEILSDASKASAGVTSFHFKLTHQNGSTPLPL